MAKDESADRALIRSAAEIDLILDRALGRDDSEALQVKSWEDILRRNGREIPKSRFELSTRDHVLTCVTGITGAVLDLSKSFSQAMTNENLHTKFDEMSRRHIEKVTGREGIAAIDNAKGGARGHRLDGPSHDLARFFEAIRQIMRGEFRQAVAGVAHTTTRYRPGGSEYLPIDDPLDAVIVLLLHLIGDFFSQLSLPIPGRTHLAESENREVVRRVFKEYREGGNLREMVASFLNDFSGAMLICLVLRLYRYVDIFLLENRNEFRLADLRLAKDLKYRLLVRNAQTISFVISVGKAAFTSNPLGINYVNFIQIVRSGAAINRLSRDEQDRFLLELDALQHRVEAL